jgi:hypothetical protein
MKKINVKGFKQGNYFYVVDCTTDTEVIIKKTKDEKVALMFLAHYEDNRSKN